MTCKTCEPKPGKAIPVEDVYNPICPDCGKELIMKEDFTAQLKKFSPILYDIHKFIIDAKKLGYGSVELVIKTHNYVNKVVEMKAVKPKKKTLVKSITKKVMIKSKKNEKNN